MTNTTEIRTPGGRVHEVSVTWSQGKWVAVTWLRGEPVVIGSGDSSGAALDQARDSIANGLEMSDPEDI